MRNSIICVLISLIFSFCRNEDPGKEMNAWFEKEIANRRQILDTLKVSNDSLKINTAAVHEEVADLILLSKDVENLSACVNRANAYFLNLANSYGINQSDFGKVSTEMHINVIAITLKQNELNLLNQLIFKSRPNQLIPYTAQ
ncbi:hypothetical protein CNR22_22335 [Sphingobacteriaceae bacterium]|nr:hypothetical protein CNR22_22335 [Sphingobacteriaceae bacterium]